jgi:hypothetical protein
VTIVGLARGRMISGVIAWIVARWTVERGAGA